MNFKRAYLSSIYKEKNKRQRVLGIPTTDASTTVNAVLLLLKSLFPKEKFQRHLPPIILKHQIYAFFTDRTEADKQVNEMRKKGDIRLFKLGTHEEEFAIVFLEDYVHHVQQVCPQNAVVSAFMLRVVMCCPDISYTKEQLIDNYFLKEENIRELVHYGLLISRDVSCYWLSVPQIGEFMKTFLFGRRATLQFIRRTKYKEMLQSDLEQRKLPRKAVLGLTYHIYDLIGNDLVKCIETSSGRMLQLQQESQKS